VNVEICVKGGGEAFIVLAMLICVQGRCFLNERDEENWRGNA
jgi:hypothetical protein